MPTKARMCQVVMGNLSCSGMDDDLGSSLVVHSADRRIVYSVFSPPGIQQCSNAQLHPWSLKMALKCLPKPLSTQKASLQNVGWENSSPNRCVFVYTYSLPRPWRWMIQSDARVVNLTSSPSGKSWRNLPCLAQSQETYRRVHDPRFDSPAESLGRRLP